MQTWVNQRVAVLGLGASGAAAARLLLKEQAKVVALDQSESAEVQATARTLRELGAEVHLGPRAVLPVGRLDWAVVSPGVPETSPWMRELRQRQIEVIGEFELGYQRARCMNVAITGTNGKTTTTELVARLLEHSHRKTVAAGNIGLPVCDVVELSRELDYLTLEVSSFQLETIRYFRPSIAVVLNLTPDHLDRYPSMADYVRAKARIFANQQAFDWAVVQSEAMAQMLSLGVKVSAKLITFSANNRRADLTWERGMIISRLAGWEGPLYDMDRGRLRGPHNAENAMAALAVGHILRLPLEEMVTALAQFEPGAHRCELVAEANGIRFVNDSKATNLDAVHKAILTMPNVPPNDPNVLLIAGGKDKGLEYHDIGPLLAQRVKHAFLLGETRDRIRAAWSLFTPCTLVDSMEEGVRAAGEMAYSGDVVLLSPGCSSFDQFRNYQHRGDVFRRVVNEWIREAGATVSPSTRSPRAG